MPAATPGTFSAWVSTEAGNASGKLSALFSSTVRSSTTTSFLTFTASKMSENARLIWPVRTNVPEIIATPSTIESAVRRARNGRARRLANVRPSIARYSSDLIWSRISSEVMLGRSATISPSLRNTTRSAMAAARASWVTITIVWP